MNSRVIAAKAFTRRRVSEIVVAVPRRGSYPNAPGRRVADDSILNRDVEGRAGMRVKRDDATIGVNGIDDANVEHSRAALTAAANPRPRERWTRGGLRRPFDRGGRVSARKCG